MSKAAVFTLFYNDKCVQLHKKCLQCTDKESKVVRDIWKPQIVLKKESSFRKIIPIRSI